MNIKSLSCEYFEEAVLTMDPDQIRGICKKLDADVFLGKALGLACRFRGLETVKTLFECGAKFSVPAVEEAKDGSSSKCNYSLYLLNIEKQIKGAACCSGIKFPKKVKLGNENTLTQIPDSERVKVLDFLFEHSEKLCFDPSELLYYSIFARDDLITGELKRLGADLSCDRVKALTESSKKDIGYWMEFGSMMKKLSDEDFIPVISKLYGELGKKLRVSKKIFSSMRSRVSNDAMIECFKEKFEMKGVPKSFILRGALRQNDTVSLVLSEKIGWLDDPRRRDLLIDYSAEYNTIECTAWLLDFKNRTADLAAERRKAERKLERELNAPPDSPVVLNKLWSCKKLDDGTLMIRRYKGNQTEITVPQKIGKNIVTGIDDHAFSLRKNVYAPERAEFLRTIKKITLPDTITMIELKAFGGCCGLEEINIPDSVSSIGQGAFEMCGKLGRIDLPNGLSKISNGMFSCCHRLREITIPDSVEKIDNFAFDGCYKLKEVIIPDSVTEIAFRVFGNCWSLEYIKLPKKLLEIAGKLFWNCEKLRTIAIPASVKSIGEQAFDGCSGLREIVIPNGVTEIGERAFANCKNLKKVVIPVSVKKIENSIDPLCQTEITVFSGSENIVAVVECGSYAENYCKQNDISYTYKEETKNE